MQGAYPTHSVGLVCFCFASQTHTVAVIVLVLTGLCTFGLGVVSLWFVAELLAFKRHEGTRLLPDVTEEKWRWLVEEIEENWWWSRLVSGLGRAKRVVITTWQVLIVALRSVRSRGTTDSESLPTTSPKLSTETHIPYTFSGVAQSAAEQIRANNLADAVLSEKKARDSEDTTNNGSTSVRPAGTRVNNPLSEPPSSPLDPANSPEPGMPISQDPAPASAAIIKFRNIAWRVANSQPPAATMDILLKEKTKRRTTLVSRGKNARKSSDAIAARLLGIRPLQAKLEKMEIMHTLNAPTARVR